MEVSGPLYLFVKLVWAKSEVRALIAIRLVSTRSAPILGILGSS